MRTRGKEGGEGEGEEGRERKGGISAFWTKIFNEAAKFPFFFFFLKSGGPELDFPKIICHIKGFNTWKIWDKLVKYTFNFSKKDLFFSSIDDECIMKI